MKKLKIALIALMLLGLLVPTSALADGEPTYGTAVVDGNPSEWDLDNDFFAEMIRAGGQGGQTEVESKLYLRYDCETNTLYALVLAEAGVDVLEWPGDAWLKIDGPATDVDGNSGNDGTPPDFEWVWVGDELRGYEASTALSEGSHTLSAHIQVFDDDEEQTSAVYDAELEINCQEPETGSLQVTKVVEWSGVTPDPSQTFEICITGPSYLSGDCKLADYDGGILTWTDLIPGDYTVEETDPGSVWTVTGSGVTVNVPSGGSGQASVTNTHCTGELKVGKTVEWNGFKDTTKTFMICITGPSYPDGDCKEVGDGDALTWTNLIPGDYTITEDPHPGENWTVEIIGSPATVGCEPVGADVKNTYEKPTAIDLASFTVQAGAGGVTLAWETATEIDNAGFNLYRALLQDGPYTQINEALIAAEGEAVGGASYSFLDAPDYGTFYYKLEDVDFYGVSTLHGPVKVTVARPLRRPLYRPRFLEF